MVKKEKSTGFWMGLSALVISIIALALVLSVSVTGNAIFNKSSNSSTGPSSGSLIKANSCDADSICEVKSISSVQNLDVKSTNGTLDLFGKTGVHIHGSGSFDVTTPAIFRTNTEIYGSLVAMKGATIGNELPGNLTFDVAQGDIIMKGLPILNKTNSYYLCIDSSNVIYKRTSPCR